MSKRTRIRTHKRAPALQGNRLGMFVAVAAMVLLSALVVGQAAQASAGTPPLPPAKAQIEAREKQQIAAAQAHAAAKVAAQAPAAQAAPARQAGIVDMHQGPFAATVFTVRNFWQGPVGTNWLLVYAGATRNADGSTGAGAVRAYTESATPSGDYALHLLGTYAAPRGGPLTIIAVSDNLMTLRAVTGATLVFNLATTSYR